MSKSACFLTHPFRDSVVPFEFSKKSGRAHAKESERKKKKIAPQLWRLRESIGIGKLCEKKSCAYAGDTQSRCIRLFTKRPEGVTIRERERESWARSRRDNCVIPPIWRNLFVRSLERTFRVYVDGTYIYTYNSCGSHHLLRKAAT